MDAVGGIQYEMGPPTSKVLGQIIEILKTLDKGMC